MYRATIGLVLASMAGGRVHPAACVRIRVVNSALVEVKTLVHAEKIASEVFRKAGVDVLWAEGGPNLDSSGAIEFEMRLSSGKPANRYSDRTGFAVLAPDWRMGDCYATVLYPMMEAAAKSQDLDAAYVLGAAMAHELGHLLLGAAEHRNSGIMCPRLGREQLRMAARGELVFDMDEASRIRAEIARKMGR